MSFEFGPTLSYVYKTEDGLNGKSEAALQETLRMATAEEAPVEITVSLQDVIDRGSETLFRAVGGHLIGASYETSDSVELPYDGLLYAESEGMLGSGAFSVVRMGIWVRRTLNRQADKLRAEMKAMALTDLTYDPEGYIWGIPVDRLTLITGYHGENSYYYGQQADLEAIGQMGTTPAVKQVLVEAAKSYHELELAVNQGEPHRGQDFQQ